MSSRLQAMFAFSLPLILSLPGNPPLNRFMVFLLVCVIIWCSSLSFVRSPGGRAAGKTDAELA